MGRAALAIAGMAALMIAGQPATPARAGQAAAVVVAQSGAAAAPSLEAAAPNAGTAAKPAEETAPAAPKAADAKTHLSVPACSMRYAAAKISGKLNGRKWAEFRREECGEKDVEAVFPSAVAPKYSGEDPEKARTHTCADQFTANKASNANGGMKWVDKDGGYYAECMGRLRS